MGILNNKSRIIDSIITEEGRKQLSARTFKISYASFTDNETYYEKDLLSGSSDASSRIMFEARSKPNDAIVLEANDAGLLLPRIIANNQISVRNGQIISGSNLILANNENFASLSETVLNSSLTNFQNLKIIGSKDYFDDDYDFILSNEEITFDVTNTAPINFFVDTAFKKTSNMTPFYEDKRLSHLPLFDYLPPVDKEFNRSIMIDNCPDSKPYETFYEVQETLEGKELREITFTETSRENNLLIQLFDENNGLLKKLDIIDYGEFITDDEKSVKRVFFVGKVFKDELRGIHIFSNILTLIME